MSRQVEDYAALGRMISEQGGTYEFREVSGGPVLREHLKPHLMVDWVSLPEFQWFRAMVKDDRRVPLAQATRVAFGEERPMRCLQGAITSRGLGEGWTHVGANTDHDLESSHYGFTSIMEFRDAVHADAYALDEALSLSLAVQE